jgi:hypothetical protein
MPVSPKLPAIVRIVVPTDPFVMRLVPPATVPIPMRIVAPGNAGVPELGAVIVIKEEDVRTKPQVELPFAPTATVFDPPSTESATSAVASDAEIDVELSNERVIVCPVATPVGVTNEIS